MDTKKFTAALTTELATVEAELTTLGRRNPKNPSDWEATPAKMDVDPADDSEIADSIEEFEEHTAILKQLEIRYNELRAALQRIQEGTYGRCQVCGKEIEVDRLGANPAATTCKEHMK